MKKLVLVALAAICLGAVTASAQSYKLEFSGGTSVSSCELASSGVGVSSVHVILTGSGGVTAVL
ncbi:MAG: hypothetical protein OEY69_09160, partial [Candidatus Krumholzibacteria bacterium]|nr:hypothetical protein [Candidatus Krumholzibacteria bacterium]